MGDVAVSNGTPSRRSILSKIIPSSELDTPVSNTDAVLRARPSTSGSNNSGSTRKKSNSKSEQRASTMPPTSNGGYLAIPNGNGDSNGNGLARRDTDNRSNTSRTSARGVISGLLSRSRTGRSSSTEPESTVRRTGSRLTNFRNKGAQQQQQSPPQQEPEESYDNEPSNGHVDEPVAAPLKQSRPAVYTNGEGRTRSSGFVRDSSVPVHPQQANGRNGNTKEAKEEVEQSQSNGGVLGGAVAAIAGAGAAAGGAAAALASKVTGNGAASRGADSDDEFHDAELADIEEHDDEEEDAQQKQKHRDAAAQKLSKPQQPSREVSHQSQQQHHRHRGLSEGEGVALGAGAGAGAAGAGFAASRKSSTRPNHSPEQSYDGRTESVRSGSSRAPSAVTTKRRSGSVPVGGENTPSDQKARNETPFYVREKAARVRKLTFDDVNMTEEEMFADIAEARKALHLFLNSRMIEAEELISKYSDQKLYYALGDALIAVIKGFMTFEPEDLAKAISYCKDALHMAGLLRKQSNSVASFGRFVRGTGHGPSTMHGMSNVQRHAELIYAESLLLKAVMGILYSGDFFGFVAEALNMRNAYGVYRSLSKYVEWADDKASGARDKAIDEDFRSGVYLGNGLISMILGLLPGKVLKIMEVFGYTGDTAWALKTLARAGEWTAKSSEPGMAVEREGVRRQVCDMGILLYHLVISTFLPVGGVDIDFADKVLHYNLERYPQGVFFLYFSGRLYSTQSLAERAIVQFKAARDVQREYIQLQHICVWDMSLCHMSLTQFDKAYDCFRVLLKDSNWSKCVYSYGEAANLYSTARDANDRRRAEAAKIFTAVPDKMQRIAGKSIPMEKFCARKAKKFIKQERLLLPALEFSYIYHCFTNAPAYSLSDNQLVDISEALQEINQVQDPSEYHSGADEYWDDYCLAHFLRGVTLRYIAYPEKHAKLSASEEPIPANEAAEQAQISLRNVIEASHRISLDHYLCYFAHYELGRLLASEGDKGAAREQFEMIMSGKHLEASGRGKGKYGMQNMCTLRSNGALQQL